MAALDAQVVDPLGEVEDGVALESQVVERVHPLAAGVEVDDGALVGSLADLGIPGTESGALEAGTQGDAVLVEALFLVGDHGAPPVVPRDRAPVLAVPHALP